MPELFAWGDVPLQCNPLNPMSDEHLISPYIIMLESNIKVMRIKEVVTREGTFWLANKFSLSAPYEMYREQCGENAYRF